MISFDLTQGLQLPWTNSLPSCPQALRRPGQSIIQRPLAFLWPFFGQDAVEGEQHRIWARAAYGSAVPGLVKVKWFSRRSTASWSLVTMGLNQGPADFASDAADAWQRQISEYS